MNAGMLLLAITVSVCAVGYLEIRHQAERETWRAEMSRLDGELENAKRLADKHAEALSQARRRDRGEKKAATELAELEAQILDAAAELARLESDRSVARHRADTALVDLKDQVRALTTIEMDIAALGKQRQRIEADVESTEARLLQAEAGAAERQKRSEALDRDIASLAIRKETVLAKLEATERTLAANALAKMAEQSTAVAVLPKEEPAAQKPEAVRQAKAPAAIVEPAVVEERDRSRGLYQFGSLSADPLAVESGQGGLPPSSSAKSADRLEQKDGSANWAEDQYLLGLRLLTSAEQNSGTRELNEAILAFKAVLGEWPKQRDPMRWAIARSDFGYALALLGKRQGDAETLEQAAVACRDALGHFKRSETPLLWAAAQHHLGVSLSGLADISDDPDLRQASIEALSEAIGAFKDAGADGDARKVEKRLRETTAEAKVE
ncbi:MAG: hypothetical protein AAGA21_15325 [Pseudomonadota bacterium]